MNSPRALAVRKHGIYIISLILIYLVETTPIFLEIRGVKPFLLVPAAIAIAMFEDELTAGIYGIVAGVLCDTAGFVVFGYNTIMLLIGCVIISSLVQHLLQPTIVTYILYTLAVTMTVLSLQFVFIYGVWRLTALSRLYMQKVVWVSAYTTVISPIFLYIYKKLARIKQKKVA